MNNDKEYINFFDFDRETMAGDYFEACQIMYMWKQNEEKEIDHELSKRNENFS